MHRRKPVVDTHGGKATAPGPCVAGRTACGYGTELETTTVDMGIHPVHRSFSPNNTYTAVRIFRQLQGFCREASGWICRWRHGTLLGIQKLPLLVHQLFKYGGTATSTTALLYCNLPDIIWGAQHGKTGVQRLPNIFARTDRICVLIRASALSGS